jgi:hypothetical protein
MAESKQTFTVKLTISVDPSLYDNPVKWNWPVLLDMDSDDVTVERVWTVLDFN